MKRVVLWVATSFFLTQAGISQNADHMEGGRFVKPTIIKSNMITIKRKIAIRWNPGCVPIDLSHCMNWLIYTTV